MNHSDVRNLLSDYLEGDLPLSDRALIDAHLDECAACAEELRTLRSTIHALRTLPADEPAAQFSAAIFERVSQGEGRRRWYDALGLSGFRRRSPWVPVLSMAGAAAALLLVVRFDMGLPTSQTTLAPAELGVLQATGNQRERRSLVGASAADEAPTRLRDELERALTEPAAFVERYQSLPVGHKEAWLEVMVDTAGQAGVTAELARVLRELDSAPARDLAARFQADAP